ncbi:hypothetical protein SynBOUM118_02129 [Synechococcus sp. BOUM118]|nr:hypothetical protein SynBOUM118_02129 [Synechococcus sp. BOUM118]
MYSLKNEHEHLSITERWEALDEYFVCISECDLDDGTCVTTCLRTHLQIDDGSDLSMVS